MEFRQNPKAIQTVPGAIIKQLGQALPRA